MDWAEAAMAAMNERIKMRCFIVIINNAYVHILDSKKPSEILMSPYSEIRTNQFQNLVRPIENLFLVNLSQSEEDC